MRVFAALLISVAAARGADLPAAHESLDEMARAAGLRSWKISIAPLVTSQTLDAASSYGMRELNPLLASSNGGFEMKAAAIKLGATGVLVGVEYLVVRKYPRSARAISKLNWTTGIITTGFAVHNFAIR
ncbi:MAG TPA: hypothetical protein VK752_26365 [Bryobacteraceae bacterium]|jgi:hypothetical protein|nr:hypothetical protein [Bryobacteraceae bacterium]